LLRVGCKIPEFDGKLGLSEKVLRRWIERLYHDDLGGHAVMSKSEHAELIRLRRENKPVTMQRDILMKAAAWLSKETFPFGSALPNPDTYSARDSGADWHQRAAKARTGRRLME
jgi:transposase